MALQERHRKGPVLLHAEIGDAMQGRKGTRSPPCDVKWCVHKAIAINVYDGLKLCETHRNIHGMLGRKKFIERFLVMQR